MTSLPSSFSFLARFLPLHPSLHVFASRYVSEKYPYAYVEHEAWYADHISQREETDWKLDRRPLC